MQSGSDRAFDFMAKYDIRGVIGAGSAEGGAAGRSCEAADDRGCRESERLPRRPPEDIIEALKAVETRYPGLDRLICAIPLGTRSTCSSKTSAASQKR